MTSENRAEASHTYPINHDKREAQRIESELAPATHRSEGLSSKQKLSTDYAKQKSSSSHLPIKQIGRFRHVIAILALSGIVLANMNRQAYNQALVRMIRRSVPTSSQSSQSTSMTTPIFEDAQAGLIDGNLEFVEPIYGLDDETRATTTTTLDTSTLDPIVASDDDRFDWSGNQISWLQAAFSYGYMPFMIPGGRLSEIYGAKWIIFLSGFGSAFCSLLTPWLADHSFILLLAARFSMGICQTGISPALYALLTRWLPPEESFVYLAMIKVGVMIGFVMGSWINGFLPWRLMFYVVGIVGLLWTLLWTVCVSSRPEEHKFLSSTELEFIKQCLRERDEQNNIVKSSTKHDKDEPRNRSAPWWNIITNPVVIAFTLTKFTVKLSTDAQSSQIPMYLMKVFHVSDKVNGFLTGTNFLIQAVFTGFVAYSAKYLIARRACGLDKTVVRKMYQGINNFGMALAYLLISLNFGSLNVVYFAVIVLSVSSMYGSGGEAVLPVDLTTEYSASIMAIANSAANLSGIVLPTLVSFLLNNDLESPERWTNVWWFVGGAMALGGLIFVCFVDPKLQDFNKSKKQEGICTMNGKAVAIEMTNFGPITLKNFKQLKTDALR